MPPPDRITERVNLSIPVDLFALLSDWAEQQKRPIASLCTWLLHRSVEAAIDSGEFVPSEPEEQPPSLAEEYIKALQGKGSIDALSLQQLADRLGLESEALAKLLKDCCCKTEGKKHAKR